MMDLNLMSPPDKSKSLIPLYILSISGDFLLSLMIVASLLVGEALGVDDWMKGLLGGAYGIPYMIAPVLFGFVSDKLGRRNCLILATSGIICVGVLFVAFSMHFWVLVAGEVLVGVLNGLFWPSIEALTSERGAGIDHQKRISYFCISWSIGYMLGPFIAPILDDYNPTYSFVIFTAIAVVNLGVVLKLLAAAERGIKNQGEEEEGKINGKVKGVSGLILTSTMLILLASTYAFVKAFIIGYYPDMSKNLFGWSGLATGMLMFVFGLSRTLSFVLSSFVKFRGFSWGIGFSIILSGSVFLLLVSGDYAWVMFIFMLSGFLTGLTYATSLDKLMKVNEAYKGFAAGWFESSMGIGTLVSPIIGGLVLSLGNESLSYVTIGLISALIATTALTIFLHLKRKEKGLESLYSSKSSSSPVREGVPDSSDNLS